MSAYKLRERQSPIALQLSRREKSKNKEGGWIEEGDSSSRQSELKGQTQVSYSLTFKGFRCTLKDNLQLASKVMIDTKFEIIYNLPLLFHFSIFDARVLILYNFLDV
jgi:hypothetical protein